MNTLLILAQHGFQDFELSGTRDALLDAGFDVVLGSTSVGPCTGKFGSIEQATVAIADVGIEAFDRIAFIGGPGAAVLADDVDCQRIAKAQVDAKKPLGAICIAPTILAKAGVLRGKKATVWDRAHEQASLLEVCGATYTGEPVTVDGLMVTANGPEAAPQFGRVFAAL
ncbi:MAG: DJ-1/PfpI family protein [Candidatus Peribacteraceae bacterium]